VEMVEDIGFDKTEDEIATFPVNVQLVFDEIVSYFESLTSRADSKRKEAENNIKIIKELETAIPFNELVFNSVDSILQKLYLLGINPRGLNREKQYATKTIGGE